MDLEHDHTHHPISTTSAANAVGATNEIAHAFRPADVAGHNSTWSNSTTYAPASTRNSVCTDNSVHCTNASRAFTPNSDKTTRISDTVKRNRARDGRFMLRACALVAALCLLPAFVSACSHGDAASSGESGQSGQSGVAEVQMSGEYEVGPDGKLKKPQSKRWTAPEMNAVANQHNDTGAEIFATTFVSVVEYAWNTGDVAPMQELCDSECASCQEMMERITSLYSTGGWVEDAEYQFRQIITQMPYSMSGTSDGRVVALWITAIDRDRYDGVEFRSDETQEETQWELHLIEKDDSWLVRSMSIRIMESEG